MGWPYPCTFLPCPQSLVLKMDHGQWEHQELDSSSLLYTGFVENGND